MLLRVVERVKAAGLPLAVATDDERIFRAVQAWGAEVWMTRSDHPSGTDRLLEVAQNRPGFDAYLNVQGDEPFVSPATLHALVRTLEPKAGPAIGTLVRPIRDIAELHNPHAVKAVRAHDGRALYFSRQALPYQRDPLASTEVAPKLYWKHLGLYAFPASVLEVLRRLVPSPLENAEGLEQLRWLEAGLTLRTGIVADESPAIDTPEDLARVEALIDSGQL